MALCQRGQNLLIVFCLRDGRIFSGEGVFEFRLIRHQPALSLAFRKSFEHSVGAAKVRTAALYLMATQPELGIEDPYELNRQQFEAALDLLDRTLSGRDWLGGDSITIADICLLPYTRLAPEGGFDLSGRESLRAWIARCEKQLGLDKAQA